MGLRFAPPPVNQLPKGVRFRATRFIPGRQSGVGAFRPRGGSSSSRAPPPPALRCSPDFGFGVWGLGFRVQGLGFGFGFWGLWFVVESLRFGVWCLVFGVWCLVFGVWCFGFWVWSLGYGVWGLVDVV